MEMAYEQLTKLLKTRVQFNIKLNYKDLVIKTGQYWQKNKLMNGTEQNRQRYTHVYMIIIANFELP